jgi:hypothetical protein
MAGAAFAGGVSPPVFDIVDSGRRRKTRPSPATTGQRHLRGSLNTRFDASRISPPAGLHDHRFAPTPPSPMAAAAPTTMPLRLLAPDEFTNVYENMYYSSNVRQITRRARRV